MGLGDKYIENGAKAVQAVVTEPVLFVTFGSRVGSMQAVIGGVLGDGGAAPRDKVHRPGGKDTKLPMNFLVAVTQSAVLVYEHKMFWGRIKLKGQLAAFPRAGLHVQWGDGTIRQFLLSSANPPQYMSFEMTGLGQKAKAMIDQLTYLLATPPAPPPQTGLVV